MFSKKSTKKSSSKKVTRFTGETKMSKENKEALKLIRTIKGKLG